MSNLLEEHFTALMEGREHDALAAYSKKLVAIAHVNGKAETLLYDSATDLMQNLCRAARLGQPDANLSVLVRKNTADYGVLALCCKPFSDFISYACIVKKGKIVRMTLYVHAPSKNILLLPATPMKKGVRASRMFRKHVLAMFSLSANVITKDYAENGVVITNFTDSICDGKPQIYAFCDTLMKSAWSIIKGLRPHRPLSMKWHTKSAAGGLYLFVLEAKAFGTVMTETYWVEGDAIAFECSIADGEMMHLISNI